MGGWGGFGPIGGGPNAASQPGLPFAGIPPEYQAAVDKLIADEPDPEVAEVSFDPVDRHPTRFGIGTFLSPHVGRLAVAAGLVSLDVVAMQVGPWLLQLGIDEGVAKGSFDVLLWITGAYFAAIVAHLLIARQRILFTGRLGQRLMIDLRVRLFTHLQRLSFDYYGREKAGRIMARMTSDIPALEQLFQEGVINLAVQGVTLLFVTVVLFSMDARLTLVVLLGVVPAMVVLTVWFQRNSTARFEAVRERIADLLADLQESLSGVRVVALHHRQEHNTARHRVVAAEYRESVLSAARIQSVYGPSADFVGTLGQVVVLAVGGHWVLTGELTVGVVAAFVLYINTFFAPIQQLVQLHNTYQQGQAAARKLRDVFDRVPSIPEAPNASVLPSVRGEISFEGVTFGYDPERPVLEDLDLTIAPDETFALVGETGAGKSTIAKLVTRFYDPQVGRVCVDGTPLRDVTLASLRGQIGVVPQEPFLFAGTIRENIAFARPSASDTEVREACEAVGILERLERLPEGLDTPCHERGVTLSSGERQLIALARAFLAQPRVLILDEATSNLDLKTESLVERALDRLLEGRTAILIAHRLSTAMRARRIGVVDAGRIVELGSHDELIALGGRYAALFETWTRQGVAEAPNA